MKLENRIKRRKLKGKPRHSKRIYHTWINMRNRCDNTNNPSYANYGGRGIAVCEEWQDFDVFEAWGLANGYAENLTIERVDNNGNYCPQNCTWITIQDQQKNKRKPRRRQKRENSDLRAALKYLGKTLKY